MSIYSSTSRKKAARVGLRGGVKATGNCTECGVKLVGRQQKICANPECRRKRQIATDQAKWIRGRNDRNKATKNRDKKIRGHVSYDASVLEKKYPHLKNSSEDVTSEGKQLLAALHTEYATYEGGLIRWRHLSKPEAK